jgi:short subunit dehydrogenase-like uncharacterized protein
MWVKIRRKRGVKIKSKSKVKRPMSKNFLLYGANGYTGALIARICSERGIKPILAGRDKNKIELMAKQFSFECRAFSLEDDKAIDDGLKDCAVVLHCAGPFTRTAKPMADACLRGGVHYLDITGELMIFESLAARDEEAKKANVMLLPGTGFDVVPSDCLAAHLKRRLPTATHLMLAFFGLGRISHGTATTMIEKINLGGAIRRDGKITGVPAAWKTRKIDFGDGEKTATTIPWGDVSTAYYSTGIPNIEVYSVLPSSARKMLKMSNYIGWFLATSPMQSFLKSRIKAQPAGPSDEEREKGKTFLYGEAWDDEGNKVISRQRGPEGYTLTALAALAITQKVLDGNFTTGFQTPAKAYGADLILEIEGTWREDL